MTVDQLRDILSRVWDREISADEAFDEIDGERERPFDYSKEFWLPLTED
jgi:hypothetical protein